MNWRRLFVFLILLLFPAMLGGQTSGNELKSGNCALILIRSKMMGPPISPRIDTHVPTVVWPPSFTQNNSNRLLSLMTGIDWKGEDYDLSFRIRPGESLPEEQSFESNNFESLEKRGYFKARNQFLRGLGIIPVARPTGLPATSNLALLLALGDENLVKPVAYHDVRSKTGLIVFEAESWEEQSEISAATLGRSLVLELPESTPVAGPGVLPEEILGHVYFRGIGWPQGWPVDPETGVAGLIRARNAVRLLLHPEEVTWTTSPPAHEIPELWFDHVRGLTPTLLFSFSLIIIYVIGSAVYCIIVEHRGQLASWAMIGIALGPADLLLSGQLDRVFGIEGWFWWFVGMAALLGLSSTLLRNLFQRIFPGTHRLLGVAMTGLIACVISNPTWSALSSVFTASGNSLSAEAIGLFAAYLCGVVAFSQPVPTNDVPKAVGFGQATRSQWFARGVVALCLVGAVSGSVWWSGDDWTIRTFPLLAWLIGEGLFSWPLLILWGLLPHGPTPYGGESDVWRHGAASSPLGCIPELEALKALNLCRYLDFLLNPGAMLFGLTSMAVGIVADRYFLRQMRVLFHRDPRIKALPWLTCAIAATAALNPILLPACVMTGFGAMISVFYTAIYPSQD